MRSTSKRISRSFIAIVILLAVIIAAFLFKLFTRTRPTVIPTTAIAVVHPHKKHKRKHKSQKYIAASSSTIKTDTVKIATLKAAVPKTAVVVAALVKPGVVSPPPVIQVVATPVVTARSLPVKLFQDSVKTIKPANNFPYTTYIHANITGIVKMRVSDQYNSTTLADIPGNAKVLVLAKGPTYYRVSYNNNVGFIPKWTLKDK